MGMGQPLDYVTPALTGGSYPERHAMKADPARASMAPGGQRPCVITSALQVPNARRLPGGPQASTPLRSARGECGGEQQVRPSDVERWGTMLIDQVIRGNRVEDDRVELKSQFMNDAHEAARRIAGHANQVREDRIL